MEEHTAQSRERETGEEGLHVVELVRRDPERAQVREAHGLAGVVEATVFTGEVGDGEGGKRGAGGEAREHFGGTWEGRHTRPDGRWLAWGRGPGEATAACAPCPGRALSETARRMRKAVCEATTRRRGPRVRACAVHRTPGVDRRRSNLCRGCGREVGGRRAKRGRKHPWRHAIRRAGKGARLVGKMCGTLLILIIQAGPE